MSTYGVLTTSQTSATINLKVTSSLGEAPMEDELLPKNVERHQWVSRSYRIKV